MKNSFCITTGWGDTLSKNVRAVTPAQNISEDGMGEGGRGGGGGVGGGGGEGGGTYAQLPFGHALTTACISYQLAEHDGGTQTFAVIDGIEIFCFDDFDELKETDGVAQNGASLLKIFALHMAANAFASLLDVLNTVLQDLVDTAKQGSAQKKNVCY
jgi:hypothetical protein